MLKGFIERHYSPTPENAKLKIRFKRNGQEIGMATITTLDIDCLKMSLPWEPEQFHNGEPVVLRFTILSSQPVTVHGVLEVSHFTLDTNYQRMACCIVYFQDMANETWLQIKEIQNQDESNENGQLTLKERQYARIETLIMADIILPESIVIRGLVEDIGFGGVKLRLPLSLDLNTPVIIKSFEREQEFELNGVCVWCHPISEETGQYFIGVSFSQLIPEQFAQVRALIFAIMETTGESGLKI